MAIGVATTMRYKTDTVRKGSFITGRGGKRSRVFRLWSGSRKRTLSREKRWKLCLA